jgi:hypothetical protein
VQLHSDKHGFGSGYKGYGSKTALNEVGGMGIASAGASEDSIDLMVSAAGMTCCVCLSSGAAVPAMVW